ncbi:hypothetical protein PbB2_03065 [Candidatus Phycosocius bacilliformis]|uniref:Transporter YfdV n=1 Tax=Candidatus Phycosocius bacilliformis TaxID=1445552 RepID=A0A2P2EE78_9PROT|nr:hypothetical protein PbB2_03065 [Candidatus Phycosocius bacilliformis]
MDVAFTAILPVFLVIAIGFIVRRLSVVPDSSWAAVNSFGYWILYPAFLFSTVASADFSGPDTIPFLTCLAVGFALAGLWGLSLRLWFASDGPAFTSLFQASVRWNGFIILAAAPALYGPKGLALIALGFGPVVAFVNLMSVLVMARWANNEIAPNLAGALREVTRNPLVLGSLAGLIANLSGLIDWLGPLEPALALLGRAAMPIALISVGAALSFEGLGKVPLRLGVGVASKLVMAPFLMLAVTHVLGLPPLPSAVAIGVASMPSAPAAYVLARELGGDAPLMAGLVTASTLLALITIPLWHSLTMPA